MADEENVPPPEKPSRLVPLTGSEALEEQVFKNTSNIICIAATSKTCSYSVAALPMIHEIANAPENEKITFYSLDLDEAENHPAAKVLGISSLPYLTFYFENNVLDKFSGSNMDKLKLMCKASILRVADMLKQREKQKEEEARLAAQAAAAAAAENAAGEPVAAA